MKAKVCVITASGEKVCGAPAPTSAKEHALVRRIQAVLSPDLLKREYRAQNAANPMYGHCYVASDALYHLLGGKDAGYTPMVGVDDDGVRHWWLRGPDGEILDVTADQYYSVGKTPPYARGKGCGFSSPRGEGGAQKPGDRALQVMSRVRAPVRQSPSGKTLRTNTKGR